MTHESFSEIGMLALDMGADLDTADDPRKALDYCAKRQDHMSPYQISIFDTARMDRLEDLHATY